MTIELELDHAGIAEFLKSAELAAVVHETAEQVAGSVRSGTDAEIAVDDYQTDRAASSVTILDPRGLELQARDGLLTRAAASAGLEVTAK